MATLRFERFKCVAETDEAGSDAPYFLVFHGRTDVPGDAELVGVRDSWWDNNIESGELIQVKKVVARAVAETSVALVVAIEEDHSPDYFETEDFAQLRDGMRERFKVLVKGGSTNVAWLGGQLIHYAWERILDEADSDDFIDGERIRITTLAGELPLVHLHGEGGYYKARFATAP